MATLNTRIVLFRFATGEVKGNKNQHVQVKYNLLRKTASTVRFYMLSQLAEKINAHAEKEQFFS